MDYLSVNAFLGQGRAKRHFCLEDSCLYSAERDLEGLGDFIIRKLLKKAERQHFPLPLWKRSDRVDEQPSIFVNDHRVIQRRNLLRLVHGVVIRHEPGAPSVRGLSDSGKNRVSPSQER